MSSCSRLSPRYACVRCGNPARVTIPVTGAIPLQEEATMRRLATLTLVLALGAPAVTLAEETTGIRSSAERLITTAALQPGGGAQRSMARTWAGVGLIAGGVAMAVAGSECRVSGSFATFSQTTFLGSVNLTGRSPILSDDCRMTDFTITGNVGFDTLTRMASDYNVNELQRSIKTHIESDVHGEKVLKAGTLYGGLALVGVGALIAILWSDVPVAESVTFTPRPGGGQVGASFGF